MKKLLSLIPALALFMGVTLAVANTAPKSSVVQTKQAYQNGSWVDITGQVLGRDYKCVGATPDCTRLVNNGVPDPSSIVHGVFTPL